MGEHRIIPAAWRPLSPIVVESASTSAGAAAELETIVLKVSRFTAVREVDRTVTEDECAWSEARLIVEHQCSHELARLMDRLGFVPFGPAEWEQTEDINTWYTRYVLTQTGIEDSAPVWIAVRRALAEDRAWLANPVDGVV